MCDYQNVNYGEVHTEIIEKLDVVYRKNMYAEEIDRATNGFDTVTHGLLKLEFWKSW